jgi:hypothetical protein
MASMCYITREFFPFWNAYTKLPGTGFFGSA